MTSAELIESCEIRSMGTSEEAFFFDDLLSKLKTAEKMAEALKQGIEHDTCHPEMLCDHNSIDLAKQALEEWNRE